MAENLFTIEGFEELEKTLKNLDNKIVDKVMKSTVSKGLNPIVRRTKANAKWESIKKLVGKKAWKNKKKQITGKVYLRPTKEGRTIKLDGRDVGFEAVGMILEFGSDKRNIAPQPFMRPAAQQSKGASFNAMVKESKRKLDELANKIKSKKR